MFPYGSFTLLALKTALNSRIAGKNIPPRSFKMSYPPPSPSEKWDFILIKGPEVNLISFPVKILFNENSADAFSIDDLFYDLF